MAQEASNLRIILRSAFIVLVLAGILSMWGWLAISPDSPQPARWKVLGEEVNDAAPKFFLVLFIPVLVLPLVTILFLLFNYMESLGEPERKSDRLIRGIFYGAMVFLLVAHVCLVLSGAGLQFDAARVLLFTSGVLLCLGGNALAKHSSRNSPLSLSPPDTLEDPNIEDKVNRSMGRVLAVSGVLLAATAPWWPTVTIVLFLMIAVAWLPWNAMVRLRLRRHMEKEFPQKSLILEEDNDAVRIHFPAAPWDTAVWMGTGFCWLLLAGLPLVFLVLSIWKPFCLIMLLVTLPVTVGVLWVSLIWAPRAYSLSEHSLRVHCFYSQKDIPRATITALRPTTRQDMRWTWRIMGSGGLYGNFGTFTNKALGCFQAYTTRTAPGVLITMENGKKYLLTPTDIEGFINELL